MVIVFLVVKFARHLYSPFAVMMGIFCHPVHWWFCRLLRHTCTAFCASADCPLRAVQLHYALPCTITTGLKTPIPAIGDQNTIFKNSPCPSEHLALQHLVYDICQIVITTTPYTPVLLKTALSSSPFVGTAHHEPPVALPNVDR